MSKYMVRIVIGNYDECSFFSTARGAYYFWRAMRQCPDYDRVVVYSFAY